jgi:hypothetical protein
MAFGRQCGRSHRVIDQLGSLLLVHRPFLRIQRNLWVAGAAIGMMMWMWISAIVILLGGELNAEIEHQARFDGSLRKTARSARRGDGGHNRRGKEPVTTSRARKTRRGGVEKSPVKNAVRAI